MYENIKTIEEIDKKIRSLEIQKEELEGCFPAMTSTSKERMLEENIKTYDYWIEQAKKRRTEIIKK